ncbi:helix-turn-helix domain-containing protein [Geobacillus subterraneus]|uniref:helix-turn-helix domain-containing protein n=1 Tax=Geobacillus subterraneus TaxID=129338 RepID=UPI003CC82DFC
MQIVEACHARTISEVAREYQLAYTTVERWFYELALTQLIEESPTRIVWMSLRFVKDILMRQVF